MGECEEKKIHHGILHVLLPDPAAHRFHAFHPSPRICLVLHFLSFSCLKPPIFQPNPLALPPISEPSNPKLQTPNTKPLPKPQAPNPKFQPQTPTPKSNPYISNLRPQAPNPKPQTPNPKPHAPHPKPQTPNPKLQSPRQEPDACSAPERQTRALLTTYTPVRVRAMREQLRERST